MPGGGVMPGPQREEPEGWPMQADPPGHLEASPKPGDEGLTQTGLRPGPGALGGLH